MIVLYHAGPSVAAAKVRVALEEKNLAWESTIIDVHGGEQFGPAYRSLNPNSVVPTLVHDGSPISVLNECSKKFPISAKRLAAG
jgi:glutathione S-transferase